MAISEAKSVDEAKELLDRAEAARAYARQANDDTLLKLATKIRARAVDRAGALLKEIDSARGAHRKSGDAPTSSGRMEAAREAGMSKDQAITAIRVNNVPREQFERLVESDNPPTVTTLAEIGTKKPAARRARSLIMVLFGGMARLAVEVPFPWMSR